MNDRDDNTDARLRAEAVMALAGFARYMLNNYDMPQDDEELQRRIAHIHKLAESVEMHLLQMQREQCGGLH